MKDGTMEIFICSHASMIEWKTTGPHLDSLGLTRMGRG